MNNKVYVALKNWYDKHPKLIVAFSGGADSCLAAYLGRKFLSKEYSVAVISTSPSLKRRDLEVARKFADNYDIQLHEIITDEMQDENYLKNPSNRCYFCKSALYNQLSDLVKTTYRGYEIINGSNFDDLGDFRPGMDAAKELEVLCPFVECKITKAEIREMSKEFDLFTWDKPASPCLSSRFPYGKSISSTKLKQVEEVEDLIMNLGIRDVRVRHFGSEAKVEVPVTEFESLKKHAIQIKNKALELGFESLTIDEEGLVSGKMNRVLKLSK